MAERPIVVGVDATTTALRAVAWAAEEARLRQRPLRIVHAACGCREPCHLMRQHVLVDEAADPVSSEQPDGRLGSWSDAARRRALIQ